MLLKSKNHLCIVFKEAKTIFSSSFLYFVYTVNCFIYQQTVLKQNNERLVKYITDLLN